jgi:hypothetical protein
MGMKSPGSLSFGPRHVDAPAEPPSPADTQPTPALRTAWAVLDSGLAMLADAVREARRHGRLPLRALVETAESIREQIARDADALTWLLRQSGTGSFLHRRALGTAVTLAVLGRQLGLDDATSREVIAGGLVLDTGKLAVPVPILAKPHALNVLEQGYVRRHVERGLELVRSAGRPPARIVEMIAGHHERLDGSGYPRGIAGTQIPLFARLAAIADVFDALTLNRRYAAAISPHAALVRVDAESGAKFDDALVGELIEALGLFPTGTPVELMDGHFGFAWAQRPGRPAGPRVLRAFDPERQPLADPAVVDTDDGTSIVRALAPGELNVDAALLRAARDAEGLPRQLR